MAQKGSSARICCLFSPPHFLYIVSRIFCKTYHALTHTHNSLVLTMSYILLGNESVTICSPTCLRIKKNNPPSTS